MMKPADYYYQFMRAFHAAAGCRAIDTQRSEHADETMRAAYWDGWKYGKELSQLASRRAETLYGYEPQIIRLAGQDED